MKPDKKQITVAYGDGIGPEIMQSTLEILQEADAQIKPEVIEIGEEIYKKGRKAGIEPDSWDVIRKNKVFLKAPITTPQGGGVKSLNVTMRKTLGLFANVRPCMSYHPFVKTKHPDMDVVIVRENEEDTYGGIEHRQTFEVYQCLKLITLPGTERIVRYAFEYARTNNRKKVTCFTKDNIMKLTDGLFHDVFKKVAAEYPDIEADNMIVDIGTARLADTPENFDVVVMPNLYGDIVSDVAAQIAGSVGLAGSANVGTKCAMFEAIHGSAPDIAGQNIANPSGLLQAAVMMLVHIGQPKVAERIHNAWLKTLEDGVHTTDIYHPDRSQWKVGTDEFTAAVIERLGQKPNQLQPVSYSKDAPKMNVDLRYSRGAEKPSNSEKRELKGVDVFVYWEPDEPEKLAEILKRGTNGKFKLTMFTNRGTKVWPNGVDETFCTDHWRCRFHSTNGGIKQKDLLKLLQGLDHQNIDIIKTENLYEFNGIRAYSLGQGE
ncbi:MAG: NADP-dependent isocitrate dehydrogenase [Balneolaceae bacterium]|nr:NADP-dependent isocitrate dehydrogenase [Balneolaceae bacterium]